jgi:uncharacterized membrane protein
MLNSKDLNKKLVAKVNFLIALVILILLNVALVIIGFFNTPTLPLLVIVVLTAIFHYNFKRAKQLARITVLQEISEEEPTTK